MKKEKVSVILDTDISGDYDDVGAIAMLHALADNGEAEILATIASNKSSLVAPTIEVFNIWYGRPAIPIGVPKGEGVNQDARELHWPDSLIANYRHTLKTNDDAPDAVTVYRQILAQQPDTSVTIISVGFLTNLKNLLQSGPDDISPLNGEELVKKKVKHWVAMAGGFPEGKEANVRKDPISSKYVIDHWPTPILFSGFEIGLKIRTGLRLIKADVLNSPAKMAYAISIPQRPYDKPGRPSWDQTAVLVAIRGTKPYYNTKRGRFITAPDGSNSWEGDVNGPHRHLVEKMDVAEITREIESLMMQRPQKESKLPVIFETDMGNDVDDALALAMLFRYAKQGRVELLGISNNKQSLSSLQFLELMKRSYCEENVPLATVQGGVEGESEANSFARKVMDYRVDSQLLYSSKITNYKEVEKSVDLYRRLLAEAKDTSVVVVSVGFSTNLAALLASTSDEHSELDGMKLVAKKVKYLSVMAGNFQSPKQREFNIKSDMEAAKKLFSAWPTRIYISPFEIGASIKFPAWAIEKNLGYVEKTPLVTAYTEYIQMPYNRETWDLTSVLYAVEPSAGYFRLSEAGVFRIDDKGYTTFQSEAGAQHFYLLTPTAEEGEKIKARFVDLIMADGNNRELCK